MTKHDESENNDDEETYSTSACLDDDEKHFHCIIGHIEDIMMSSKFLELQVAFMEKYWTFFEDTEENKLVYTTIFNEYVESMEQYLEDELTRLVSNFNMAEFEAELKEREHEVDGEIFEVLATFMDFATFKTMFLDYKNMKEGKTVDFSQSLAISSCKTAEDHTSEDQ